MLHSPTTTRKQNVRFQEGPCPEKNLDRIQNGKLSAIIGTNMHNLTNHGRFLDHYSKTDSSDSSLSFCFHQEGCVFG